MHTQPKRVFLCGIAQESNAFNPIPSSLGFFGKSKATLSGYPQIKGALPYLQEQGVEVISGLFEGYQGTVQAISEDLKNVTVLIKRGNRDMPVELASDEVKLLAAQN